VISVTGGPNANQKFVVLGGFAEVNATKVTVLAEEAIAATNFTAEILNARLAQAAEDVSLAKSETEKASRQAFLDGLQALRTAI
jgi:F-type H+-transporting ATPase subunit epsilon